MGAAAIRLLNSTDRPLWVGLGASRFYLGGQVENLFTNCRAN
jgi:hypothetical protein